jgi:hypothetical protein
MHALVVHNGDDYRCCCGGEVVCGNPLGTTLVNGNNINYQASQHTFKASLELWEKILCPQQESEAFLKLQCICVKC